MTTILQSALFLQGNRVWHSPLTNYEQTSNEMRVLVALISRDRWFRCSSRPLDPNAIPPAFHTELKSVQGGTKRTDCHWLVRTALKMSAGGAIAVLLVGMTLVLLADPIIRLWMGRSFPDQELVLLGMVASATVIAITSPFNMILNAAGMARQQILPWAGFVVLCVVAKTLLVTPETTWWVPWITSVAYAACVTPRILQLAIAKVND